MSEASATAAPEVIVKPARNWTPRRVFWLAAILLLVGGMAYDAARPVDDAYITFRFAENFAKGFGLSFNAGAPPVEGYTSFGQVLLMAPLTKFNKRVAPFAAVALGILAWAGVVALTWKHIYGLRQGPLGRPEWFTILFLAACNPAIVWAWSGMETALFALCWVAAWTVHQKEYQQNQWPWTSALLTFAAGLLHPEGILIGVVLGAAWFIPVRKERLNQALLYLGLAFGLFGLYWLWRWHYFGYFFPNTYYAKVGSGGRLLLKGLGYVALGFVSSAVPVYLIYLKISRFNTWRTWPRWLVLALGMVGAVVVFNILVGGDYFPFQRFLLPAFPFIALATWQLWTDHRAALAIKREAELKEIAAEEGGAAPVDEEPVKKGRPWLWAVIMLLLLNLWSNLVPLQMKQYKLMQGAVPEFISTGGALANLLPKNAAIATIPIGALGYFSDRPIVDLMGLADVHIAHLPVATGERNVGHEKFDYKYVLDEEPDVIMQLPATFGYGETGWNLWLRKTTLNPQQYAIYDDPRLEQNYQLCWFPVDKRVIKKSKDKKQKQQKADFGAYGYVRKDRMADKSAKCRPLPPLLADRAFVEYQQFVEANQKMFGNKRLGMWKFSGAKGRKAAQPAPAAPPPAGEPVAVTPPPELQDEPAEK